MCVCVFVHGYFVVYRILWFLSWWKCKNQMVAAKEQFHVLAATHFQIRGGCWLLQLQRRYDEFRQCHVCSWAFGVVLSLWRVSLSCCGSNLEHNSIYMEKSSMTLRWIIRSQRHWPNWVLCLLLSVCRFMLEDTLKVLNNKGLPHQWMALGVWELSFLAWPRKEKP